MPRVIGFPESQREDGRGPSRCMSCDASGSPRKVLQSSRAQRGNRDKQGDLGGLWTPGRFGARRLRLGSVQTQRTVAPGVAVPEAWKYELHIVDLKRILRLNEQLNRVIEILFPRPCM